MNDHKTVLLVCMYLPILIMEMTLVSRIWSTLWVNLLDTYILANPTDELMIVGDFNVDLSRSLSQFTMILSQFMYDHGLVAVDQFFYLQNSIHIWTLRGCWSLLNWSHSNLISRTGGCHVSDVSIVHSGSNLSDHSPWYVQLICLSNRCSLRYPHM